MDNWIGKWAFPADNSLLEQTARRGGQYNFEKIAADIISKLQVRNNDAVLDVCCGNAVLTKLISARCHEIHGVDFSEKLIATAKTFSPSGELKDALHLHLSDALKIDSLFPENTFDKSYCYFSFQYFNRVKRELLLEKLSRVTKPGGKILIGDIPDKIRMWNFYKSKVKFYREKISRFLKGKEGECDLGWWIDPKEILDWCASRRLQAEILVQDNSLPHAHYRFDVLIRNSK